jgi:hypothetical protein
LPTQFRFQKIQKQHEPNHPGHSGFHSPELWKDEAQDYRGENDNVKEIFQGETAPKMIIPPRK